MKAKEWMYLLIMILFGISIIILSNKVKYNNVIILSNDMPNIGSIYDPMEEMEIKIDGHKYNVIIEWIYEYETKKVNIAYIKYSDHPKEPCPPYFLYCGTNGEAVTAKQYWGKWDYDAMRDAGFKPYEMDIILNKFYSNVANEIKYFYRGCESYKNMINERIKK